MSNETSIIGVYDTHQQAESALRELDQSGFELTRLSIVARGYNAEERPLGYYTTGDRVKVWAGTGALWGGVWGLLIGTIFFWTPAVGPLPGFFPHLVADGVGGAALIGSIAALGALVVGLRVPKREIIRYQTQIHADKYLLLVHGGPEEIERARGIMRRSQATESALETDMPPPAAPTMAG